MTEARKTQKQLGLLKERSLRLVSFKTFDHLIRSELEKATNMMSPHSHFHDDRSDAKEEISDLGIHLFKICKNAS